MSPASTQTQTARFRVKHVNYSCMMLPCLIATALRLTCIIGVKLGKGRGDSFVSFFLVFWPSFPPSHSLFIPELHATPKYMLFYQSIRIDVPLHFMYSHVHVSSTRNLEGDRKLQKCFIQDKKKGV